MKFDENIEYIEKQIGYTFIDKSLLRQAFTRASFCNEANLRQKIGYQSNEVLEFFGDSALSAAIVTALIKLKTERYCYGIKTELREGDFSNIRSKLADKKNLSDNIKRLGIHRFLIMGEGDLKLGIENERSVMEDLFESLVGAIYIDSGFDMKAVIASVELMLDLSVYLNSARAPMQSYKNMLQEWCADKKRRKDPPVYKKVSEEGPDHDKTYRCVCVIDGVVCGEGEGRNIKLAESNAAKCALIALGVIKGD
jgi:ribonuclease-3